MARQNKPALIDPADTVQRRTDKGLGIASERSLIDVLDEQARRIGGLNRELQTLRSLVGQSDPIINFSEYGDLVIPATANIVAVEAATNPGLTIGTAAGTGGSAAVSFPRGGSDVAGQIRVVCGTSGLSTGTLVTLTFIQTKPHTNYLVLFSPTSTAARSANLSVSTKSTTGFPILANTAPSSGAQIDIDYLIVEVPA